MTSARRRRSTGSEAGQTTFIAALFLVVLTGMMAAVIDVGAWMRADRKLQADADAAALAAAQELPYDTGVALSKAAEYGSKNGGGVTAADVRFESDDQDDDTVVVEATGEARGVFTGLVGLSAVDVHATAKARVAPLGAARYAAPIAVDVQHPMLQCAPTPCFSQGTTLDLEKTGPGAFRLINLDQSHGGTGPQTLADWIRNGYDGDMPVDWYFSDPGAKFNSSAIRSALNERVGDTLLFPVYDTTRGGGANFEYHVIGWVGFVVTGFEANGSHGTVDGYFTSVIWEGIAGTTASAGNFGARKVTLVE
jgi:hypothetical protein